jgi:transcriptional regulator GlxA family with amidase domain
MTHLISFYVPPRYQLLDLAGPLDTFEAANLATGKQLYQWRYLSRTGGPMTSGACLSIETIAVDDDALDTLLVIGGAIDAMYAGEEIAAVRRLGHRTTRTASICTGAFLLAGAGLLDGRRATTHWSRARELQDSFPAISVEADRIYITDGPIWTSAGVTAGIDLALALIERDHGIELSRQVARELVAYHRRPGGQSQFSALSQLEPESDRMRLALAFAREHLSEPLPIERLAEAARLSPRQFGRSFLRETGETPAKAIERLRVEAAYLRLQDGSEPVEVIARAVGFNDPERMRRAFIARFGQPPQAIRRSVRSL